MRYSLPRPLAPAFVVGAAVLFALLSGRANADSGHIDGYAVAQIGSVASVPFGGPTTAMTPSGAPQTAGTPLDRDEDVDLGLLGSLSAAFASTNATQSCEGGPGTTPVWAECYARVENATIGLGLPPLLGGGILPVATASVIEARVRCEAPNGVVTCTSTGSHIDNLCPVNQPCTDDVAGTPQRIPLNVPGIVGGSLVIGAQVERTSDGGISGAGMTVTMFSLQVQLIPVLGGDPLFEIQLAQADAFVGGLVLDTPPEPDPPTATVPADPSPPAATPTAVPPVVDPPGPPSGPTSTPTTTPPPPAPTTPPSSSPPAAAPPPFAPPPSSEPNLPGPPSNPNDPPTAVATPSAPGAPGGPVAPPPSEGPGRPPRPSVTPKPPATGNAMAERQGAQPAHVALACLVGLSAVVGGGVLARKR